MNSKLGRWALAVLAHLALLAAWYLFVRFGNVPKFVMPSPVATLDALRQVSGGLAQVLGPLRLVDRPLGLLIRGDRLVEPSGTAPAQLVDAALVKLEVNIDHGRPKPGGGHLLLNVHSYSFARGLP